MPIADLIMQLIVGAFLLAGIVFTLSGSIGLIRFPDAYCRMHALSNAVTLGIICLMLGGLIFLAYTGVGFSTKNLLAIVFIMMTMPIGSHMTAKATYHYGIPLWSGSIRDDLAAAVQPVATDNAEE